MPACLSTSLPPICLPPAFLLPASRPPIRRPSPASQPPVCPSACQAPADRLQGACLPPKTAGTYQRPRRHPVDPLSLKPRNCNFCRQEMSSASCHHLALVMPRFLVGKNHQPKQPSPLAISPPNSSQVCASHSRFSLLRAPSRSCRPLPLDSRDHFFSTQCMSPYACLHTLPPVSPDYPCRCFLPTGHSRRRRAANHICGPRPPSQSPSPATFLGVLGAPHYRDPKPTSLHSEQLIQKITADTDCR